MFTGLVDIIRLMPSFLSFNPRLMKRFMQMLLAAFGVMALTLVGCSVQDGTSVDGDEDGDVYEDDDAGESDAGESDAGEPVAE